MKRILRRYCQIRSVSTTSSKAIVMRSLSNSISCSRYPNPQQKEQVSERLISPEQSL
jgi:hypothetical protein